MNWHCTVNWSRLCDAADAILAAIETREGLAALSRIRIAHPSSTEVVAGRIFTQAELVEAIDMLVRMGVVAVSDSGRTGSLPRPSGPQGPR